MAQPPNLDDDVPPQAIEAADSGPDSQALLEDLLAKATAKYATKDYSVAAEYYSRATEMQAKLNGEMNTKNADLLYLYGRCLYHVAIQSSDVLGNKVVGEDRPKNAQNPSVHTETPVSAVDKPTISEEADMKVLSVQSNDSNTALKSGVPKEVNLNTTEINKPYFTITGDENWDDSEDELAGDGQVENDGADEVDEAEDDFSNAFEVLDVARVLLERRLSELADSLEEHEQEGEQVIAERNRLDIRKLREKLADTRDLQAEIGLEAERFRDAAIDLDVSLKIKQDLYPIESSVIAEAHYKLSLALEFSSVASTTGNDAQSLPDTKLREEAALHMESAIRSCQERIKIEKTFLESAQGQTAQGLEKNRPKVTQESLDEVKEMVCDMQQRLKELRELPLSVERATDIGFGGPSNSLLKSIVNASPELQRAKLQEVVQEANDLSSLVKRKKERDQGEKRKAENVVLEKQIDGKKAKGS